MAVTSTLIVYLICTLTASYKCNNYVNQPTGVYTLQLELPRPLPLLTTKQ